MDASTLISRCRVEYATLKRQHFYIYPVSQKTGYTPLFPTTLPNIDRFQNSFTSGLSNDCILK